VAWRGPDAKTPLLRIAVSHATADALVEIICGGSPGLIKKGVTRAPGFVERQAFATLVRDIAATIACLAAPEAPVDHVAIDQETAENAENVRPPGMAGGWIELRAEGVALRIHVAATTSAIGTGDGLPAQPDDRARWTARVKANMARMETRVVAVIEERTITLAEIAACEVGSMLALTASPQSTVKLLADDAPLFDCQLGQAGGYYTVRIAGEESPAEVG
jgi:flagellar motor switch protein FliM